VKKSIISSLEIYLPEKVVSNYDLEKMVDTTHEWIFSRTGIEQRHVVAEGEFTHDIAAKASLKTIEKEGISPIDIDAIIVATATPEKRCPSSAVRVQSIIGARNAFAFDVQAACSGFIYAMFVADSFIKADTAKKILLIGAETLTLFTDWTDRSTCVLLGDGAGSCIVKEGKPEDEAGIIDINLFSDGDKHELITITNSEKNENRGYMTMQGRAVFKHAIEYMYDSMISILKKNKMTFDDIDWIIPHQANRRVLESMSKMKGVPIEKVILTIDRHANTSSASIPLALKTSIDRGIIKEHSTLLLTAIGAGLTWGSAIIRI
jgi:3-oxoacyl-[acyl-carrier-protein] synthase-3